MICVTRRLDEWLCQLLEPSNVRFDAAARIHSTFAASLMMRNTPPLLASNDLFGASINRYLLYKAAIRSRTACRDRTTSSPRQCHETMAPKVYGRPGSEFP